MKALFICLITIVSIGLNISSTKGQQSEELDSIYARLNHLMASRQPVDRLLLNKYLKELGTSKLEKKMAIAAELHYQLKNARVYDSLMNAIIMKFPKGLEARLKAQQSISALKDIKAMERAYIQFLKDFPPKKYPKLLYGEDRLPYDRLRINLAMGFVRKNDIPKAKHYAKLLEADFWKCRAYSDLAAIFYDAGDLGNALLYQKKAVQSASAFKDVKRGTNAAAEFAVRRYPRESGTYAQFLYEKKQYKKALKYINRALAISKSTGAEFNYTHSRILTALNRKKEAYTLMETIMKSGKATPEMSKFFDDLYVSVNGSDTGLVKHQEIMRKHAVERLRDKLKNAMINEPAADFVLNDLDGLPVRLSDLKGKTVIVDFWATWCVPCKASFPAMQMALNKYKDDPKIEFLFIHTWERSSTAIADAKEYIDQMGYTFRVLMDLKDPMTKTHKVVDDYHVSSIPTKFVIDEKGQIRLRLKGSEGSNEALVDELIMSIDLVQGKER